MAANGVLTLNANVTGSPDGARALGPFVITTAAAVTETLPVALSIGANTITVPSGTTCCLILPPNAPSTTSTGSSTFAGSLTLKGVSGDTGSAISNKWPTLLSFDTAPSSIVVNSTATGTLTVWFM